MKKLVLKYQVATFYILTFIISWGGLTVLIGGPSRISSRPASTPFILMYLMTVAGPIMAGILLTGFYEGKKGYRDFFLRLRKWRVSLKWYGVALLSAPITVFSTLFILSIFSPAFIPGIFDSGTNPVAASFGLEGSNKLTLVLFVTLLGLFNGFVEELGWTGFVTPRLNKNQHLIRAGITLGIMWGLWHLLANYIGSDEGAGGVPLFIFLPVMLFSFLPPFRIIMVWVYRHTESLLIGVLMHASLDVFWMLSMPVSMSGKERMVWYVVWAVVLWSIAIIISVTAKKEKAVSNTFQSSHLRNQVASLSH